jgi:8-amino-3,8-dideoxy-alpha-D-manno-octulosonate transaminase
MTTTAKQLALNGGTPVRTKPQPEGYLGCAVLGVEELALLTETIKNQLPFREYGRGTPHMVRDFEKTARAYFDMPFALATATGSGSFFCAMAGLGIGPGDEVIIPSFGWFTDFCAPVLAGATPVFADIDRTLCMDPQDLEKKITSRTKAVIVIHYQGASGYLDQYVNIARKRGIYLIEDCAQACGATYRGKKFGSYGDVACFSFQQNKVMTTGDGGLLLARDPHIFERAVRYHDLGMVRPSLKSQWGDEVTESHFAGCQFRMNEFTGAVALAQLKKLDEKVIAVTRRQHRQLKQILTTSCPDIQFRTTGDDEGDANIILMMDLDDPQRASWLSKALQAEGIRTGPASNCQNLLRSELVQKRQQVHPLLPPFGPGCPGEYVEYSPTQCPNTDTIYDSMVCVALTPGLSKSDIQDIAAAISKVWPEIPRP